VPEGPDAILSIFLFYLELRLEVLSLLFPWLVELRLRLLLVREGE
jgi:hypothetical protein